MKPRKLQMKPYRTSLLSLAMVLTMAGPAAAYVGPGAGLTVIGAALAFLAGIVLAVIGFVWYPVKRLLRARALRKASGTPAET